MEEQLMTGIEVTPAELEQLGKERAQHILEYLAQQGGIDASRLAIVAADNALNPSTRVAFGLRE
jgi:hypothetical protein